MSPETRSRLTRPIEYGKFGSPFFNPQEIERISKGGRRLVDLFGFLSAHGLDIKMNAREHVAGMLSEKLKEHGLEKVLLPNSDYHTALFHSQDIREIEEVLYEARFEIIPYFEEGVENFNILGQWSAQTVHTTRSAS